MATAVGLAHSTSLWTERQLVTAVRCGDDRAFEELFSRYRRRIGSYIFGMVGDHGRAEDIAQEVFMSALRRLRETERPIAFKQWIYEIAKNACIDEFRRGRRAREVPLEQDEESGNHRDLLSREPTPPAAMERKQRLDDLRGAFRGLSETHHRILVLRELEGLSYCEIGERMEMSRAVVESTLFRARRRLNEEYQELVSGRRCETVRAMIDSGQVSSLQGIRARLQLARHLAHCQPCRRHARLAGVDESLLKTPSIAARLAALLPFSWLRRRLNSDEETMGATGCHSVGLVQSLQFLAPFADPAMPSAGVGRVAAALAALAIAGTGGGLLAGSASHLLNNGGPITGGSALGGPGGTGFGAAGGPFALGANAFAPLAPNGFQAFAGAPRNSGPPPPNGPTGSLTLAALSGLPALGSSVPRPPSLVGSGSNNGISPSSLSPSSLPQSTPAATPSPAVSLPSGGSMSSASQGATDEVSDVGGTLPGSGPDASQSDQIQGGPQLGGASGTQSLSGLTGQLRLRG